MRWSDTLSLPLWLLLVLAVLALLGMLAVTELLRKIALWLALQVSNARRNRLGLLRSRMRKYPLDLRSPVLESRPFTVTKPWR